MPPYHTTLGHIHLKVRDLERAVGFYTRVLGLEVRERLAGRYAFLSGGPAHHELVLQQVGAAAPVAAPHGVGLFHVAFAVADRRAFALAVAELEQLGVSATAVDRGISWAVHFRDPDGNGLEIYCDTRDEQRDPAALADWHAHSRPLGRRALEAARRNTSVEAAMIPTPTGPT
jgi:catechol 2,3-dioxygenase